MDSASSYNEETDEGRSIYRENQAEPKTMPEVVSNLEINSQIYETQIVVTEFPAILGTIYQL